MEISISRTYYVKPLEPIVVSIKDSADVQSNKDYNDLKNRVIACVSDCIASYIETVKTER